MTTKKQQSELQDALAGWVFEGIAETWSASDIMKQAAADWQKVCGLPKSSKGMKDLADWQATVLSLVGLRTEWESMAVQRMRSASIVLSAHSGAGPNSVMAVMGASIAEDILADSFTGREELRINGEKWINAIS